MADKFAITAELQLALDSRIDTKINELKSKIKKAGIDLPISIRAKDVESEIARIKKISNTTIDFNFNVRERSVKRVLAEVRAVKQSIERKPVLASVGFDVLSLQKNIKIVLANVRSVKESIRKQDIVGRVGFDIAGLRATIKTVLSEARGLRTSLQAPLVFRVEVANKKEFENFISIINSVKSKTISFGLELKKDTVGKFGILTKNLKDLNAEISSFNTGRFTGITQTIGSVSRSLTALSKLAGKKITFDLSLKDAKAAGVLADGLLRASTAFNKAAISAGNFGSAISNVSVSVRALQSALSTINVSNVNTAAKSIQKLSSTSSIQTQQALSSAIQDSTNSLYDLGVQSAITLKRFGAYTIVTAGFFRLTFAVRNALHEFVEFDAELTKIRQVTKQSLETTRSLGDEVGRLATTYGVSSQSILNTSQVLAQAGFTTEQTKQALEALTKTEIAPTFDNIENTVEGAIAAMAQFNIETSELDSTLSSINSVAAAFAVESEDITTAIQKAGGAFQAAGGNLEELQALFTSVRSTTRESADTIATGFRTIFTRLQRVRTGKFLQDFGINIRKTAEDVKVLGGNVGDFVGPYLAIQRISQATQDLSTADPRFAQIAEELGGFRQINKVIPLLKQFAVSEDALRVAQTQRNSLTEDSIIAQESYANQLEKVRQEFLLLIREIAEDKEIKALITSLLDLTKAGIQVANTFKDILPLIGAIGVIKAVPAAKTFFSGFKDTLVKRNQGGLIPGGGPDKDSVPALLTKGEFVLNRKAVKNLGADNLSRLNKGFLRRNKGGPIGFNAGGNVTAGLAAGAGALYVAQTTGLLKSFTESEGALKDFTSTVIGTIAQIVLLKGAVVGIGNDLSKKLKGGVASFGNSLSKFSKTVGPDSQTLIDQNKKATESSIKGDIKVRNSIARQIIQEKKYRGENNSNLVENIKQQKQVARQMETLTKRAAVSSKRAASFIEKVKVDPRSFAGRQLGLKEQFRIRDDNTGTFRNFATKREAALFGDQNNSAFSKSLRSSIGANQRIAKLNPQLRNLRGHGQDLRQRLNISPVSSLNNRLLGATEARIFQKQQIQKGLDPLSTNARLQNFVSQQSTLRGRIGSFFRPGPSGSGPGSPRSPITRRIGSGISKINNVSSGSVAGFSLAAGLAGNAISGFGRRRFGPTEDFNGSKTGFVGSSFAGGALGGAAVGATIGSLVPVIGTAVGGIAGALIGGGVAIASSISDFDNALASISSKKNISNLEKVFADIGERKTTTGQSSGIVLSNFSQLQNTLQSTADQETRQDIKSGIVNNATNITAFIRDVASLSGSYQQFSQRVDVGTQLFISGLLNIPFEDFKKSIVDTIRSNKEKISAENKATQAIQDFDSKIRSANAFANAFAKAELSVNSFTENLKNFAFGGGATSIQNNVSPRLSNLALADSNSLSQVSGFTSQFGSAGDILNKSTQDAAKVIQELPNILLDLRSQSALAKEGDLELRLDNALSNLRVDGQKIDPSVVNLVVSRFEDLLGEDFKDSNFFKSLNKDFPKAVSDLSSGLENIPQTLAQAYTVANNKVNEFSSNLDQLKDLDKRLLDGQSSVIDGFGNLIQSRGIFSGKDVSNRLLTNERGRVGLFTGGRSVGQLGNSILSGRNNIQNLSRQIDNTEDLSQKGRLIELRSQEIAAVEKATNGLQFLANSTNKLTILQGKLNVLQSERESRRNIATDFAFGSTSDKNRIRRTIVAAQQAQDTGSLSSVPNSLRSGVRQILEGSQAGRDAINKIIAGETSLPEEFRTSGRPSADEKTIQQQIEAAIGTQIEAQQKLNDILKADREGLSANIRADFAKFLTDLKAEIVSGQARETQSRISELENRRTRVLNQAKTFKTVESKFGPNALNNFEEINQLNKSVNNDAKLLAKLGLNDGALSRLKTNQVSSLSLGDPRIKRSSFDHIIDKELAILPEQIRNRVKQDLSTSDLEARDDNTIDKSAGRRVVIDSLKAIDKEAITRYNTNINRINELSSNVGGRENFDKIAAAYEDLKKYSETIDTSTDLKEYNRNAKALAEEIAALRASLPSSGPNPIRRNSGGIVPGIGSGDTVPALLTPGEYVLNKRAVRNIGIETLRKTNSGARRFQSGGLVQGSGSIIDTESISRFNNAVNQLAIQVQNMKDAFAAIPTEINMVGRHTVDVYINGSQAFATMKEEFASLVQSEIKKGINNLIKKKLPDLGTFDG